MGLFGLREEKTDKDVQQERLYAARNAYDDRRTAFRDVGDTIELDCLEGQSWLPYAGVQLPVDTNTYVQFPEVNSNYRCVRLRIDSDAFALFPEVNPYDFSEPEALDRLIEIRLPRTAYRLEHTPPVREPVKEEGDHLFFQWPKFEVTLAGEQTAVLRAHDLHRACTFFAKHPDVVSAHALFDLWDGPDYSVVFSRENPPAGCPSGRYDIWREGDDLYFYQPPTLYARKPEFLEVWHWKVSAITYYRAQGELSHEYITSGGEVEFDYGACWRPHLTHVGFLEDAVSVTPVHTEKIEHDSRYTELMMADGRMLKLSYSSLDSLRQLMPEKEFDKLPLQAQKAPQTVQGREPTTVEQLKILADLVDRGYLSREEYDAAKVRLLEKI